MRANLLWVLGRDTSEDVSGAMTRRCLNGCVVCSRYVSLDTRSARKVRRLGDRGHIIRDGT